jgi:Permeases of the drug/metabolite transporter (DMT) superfamily
LEHRSRFLVAGFLFAILWSSASAAGKFGLMSSEPLTLFTIRFLLAGFFLLVFSLFQSNSRLPKGGEWTQLTIFGLLNTTLYLGIFIIALQEVAAGITTLSLALNPLMISIITSLWSKRKITIREWTSIALGIVGVIIATYPLVKDGYASLMGLCLLFVSMFTYSLGAVYYSSVKWNLTRTSVNGWQVLIGGLILLPFTVYFEGDQTQYDLRFWMSVGWLVIPVSIGAVQLWLYLLKEDAVKASLWLFLCPVFGLVYASILLNEPFTVYTLIGAVFVLVSLYWGQRKVKA